MATLVLTAAASAAGPAIVNAGLGLGLSVGTGIGLSLVYRTVQLHNGDIDVESTPGVGTTFVIKMPKVNPAATASLPTPSLRAESERLRKTS